MHDIHGLGGGGSLSRSSLCNMYDTRDTPHHIQLNEALKMRNACSERGSRTMCTLSRCNKASRHWHETCSCVFLANSTLLCYGTGHGLASVRLDASMFLQCASVFILEWLEMFRDLKSDNWSTAVFLQLCSVPVTSILTESFVGHEGGGSPPWEAVIPWSPP